MLEVEVEVTDMCMYIRRTPLCKSSARGYPRNIKLQYTLDTTSCETRRVTSLLDRSYECYFHHFDQTLCISDSEAKGEEYSSLLRQL